jgi:hypothetical protein
VCLKDISTEEYHPRGAKTFLFFAVYFFTFVSPFIVEKLLKLPLCFFTLQTYEAVIFHYGNYVSMFAIVLLVTLRAA